MKTEAMRASLTRGQSITPGLEVAADERLLARRGVAVCGSGVEASICANKVPGARAGLIHDHLSAGQGVEDDHMNIICLGGRTVGPSVAWELVQMFLVAEYSQAPRHLRRLSKVALLELQPTRTSR